MSRYLFGIDLKKEQAKFDLFLFFKIKLSV